MIMAGLSSYFDHELCCSEEMNLKNFQHHEIFSGQALQNIPLYTIFGGRLVRMLSFPFTGLFFSSKGLRDEAILY